MGGGWRVVYFSGGQQPDLFLRLCAYGGYQRKYPDAGGVSMILNPIVSGGGGGVETVTGKIGKSQIVVYFDGGGLNQVNTSGSITVQKNSLIYLQNSNSFSGGITAVSGISGLYFVTDDFTANTER